MLWRYLLVGLGTISVVMEALKAFGYVSKTLGYHFERIRSFLTRFRGTWETLVWQQNPQESQTKHKKQRKSNKICVCRIKDGKYDEMEGVQEGVLA